MRLSDLARLRRVRERIDRVWRSEEGRQSAAGRLLTRVWCWVTGQVMTVTNTLFSNRRWRGDAARHALYPT
jgi:hypothetical protein